MIDDLLPLGVASDYADLHRILRERADALGISRLDIDEIAGTPVGYASKILAPAPTKHLGATSLGLILGALGLVLQVCESPAQVRRVGRRWTKRDERNVRTRASDSLRALIRRPERTA